MSLKSLAIVMAGMLAVAFLALPAHAATKNWIGCPISSSYSVDPGPRYSVSWVVSGERRVIAFQQDKILLGGGKGMMTLGQLNQWKHVLDGLNTAAAAKVKVAVYYDDVSGHVLTIAARYNQTCP